MFDHKHFNVRFKLYSFDNDLLRPGVALVILCNHENAAIHLLKASEFLHFLYI